MKRAIDFLCAAIGLIATGPVLVLTAAAIVLADGPPVLFRHERAGQHGRPFTLLKFRTMRAAPNQMESTTAEEGERITAIGRWLRRTSVDELPQLVNVLRGDISLVGPRPLPVRYVSRYSPEQRRRLDVPAGITGWAQINGRNAISWDQRLALDVWYVDHRSLALDLRILARTVAAVLRTRDTSAAGQAIMDEFRGQF